VWQSLSGFDVLQGRGFGGWELTAKSAKAMEAATHRMAKNLAGSFELMSHPDKPLQLLDSCLQVN
jgi:hypothetical protein